MRPGPTSEGPPVTPALFHVSHEGPFSVLHPRPSPPGSREAGRPLVWAVDEDHLASYLVPRDCPRVCWRDGDEHVVCIEAAWLDRLDLRPLLVHRLSADGFTPWGPPREDGGYWLSATPARVHEVDVVHDCRGALAARGAELRSVEDLWPLVDEVVASTLEFSCIRMRNARPRNGQEAPT